MMAEAAMVPSACGKMGPQASRAGGLLGTGSNLRPERVNIQAHVHRWKEKENGGMGNGHRSGQGIEDRRDGEQGDRREGSQTSE